MLASRPLVAALAAAGIASTTACGAQTGGQPAGPNDAGGDVAGDGPTALPSCEEGQTTCAGSCVDLSVDMANCGTCGHDCLGGSCDNGMCTAVTIASNQVQPWAITVDNDRVYWATTDGSVLSCPKAECGGGPTVVATGQATPLGIAVDGQNVFWTTTTGVAFCPLTGCNGSPSILATQDHPRGIALDNTNVYWTDYLDPNGSVATCPKAGCPAAGPTVLASNQQAPLGIVVASGTVFWTDNNIPGYAMSCASAGCSGAPNQVAFTFGSDGIAASASKVFWVEQGQTVGQPVGALNSCPLSSPCSSPVTVASGLTDPRGLAIDENTAYFTSFSGGAVLKCALAGCGNSPTIVADKQSSPYAIAVDSTAVYWTNRGDNTIRKIAK